MWLFTVGFSHRVLFSVSVESLAMNICSRMVGLGAPGQGEGGALPSPDQAEGKVRSPCGVAGGGQEGREAGVLLSDPERQWSEHLAASWRR